MDTPGFYLRTVGSLALLEGGPEGRQLIGSSTSTAILAYLATRRPGHTAARDHVATLFWPGAGHASSRHSLRQALYYLSRAGADGVFHADNTVVRVEPSALGVDLWAFDEAVRMGRYEDALAVGSGSFLPAFRRKAGRELEQWIEAEEQRIQSTLQVAYEKAIAGAVEAGELGRAVEHAEGYAELHPLSDRSRLLLMRVLAESGDPVGALERYEEYRVVLRRELGAEPEAKLTELAGRLSASVLPEDGVGLQAPELAPAPPESSGEPDRPAHRERPFLPGRFRTAALVATVVVLTAAATAFVLSDGPDSSPRQSGAAAASSSQWARVFAMFQDSSGARTHYELRFSDDSVRMAPLRLPTGRYRPLSPDGRYVATSANAGDGLALAVRDLRADTLGILVDRPDDEWPVGWSPDGRYVLYTFGRSIGGGNDYAVRLAVYDLERHRSWPLSDLDIPRHTPAIATWSPDGTRIAFEAHGDSGGTDVFVASFDGSGLVNVSKDRARDGDPAWSPDGQRLAFISFRDGNANVYTVDPTGEAIQQVTSSPQDERDPVWIDDSTLAFALERETGTELWRAETVTLRSSRLMGASGLREIFNQSVIPARDAWVESLAIGPHPDSVIPAEQLRLDVRARDAGGRPVPTGALPVRWIVDPPSALADLGDGAFRVTGTGPVSIVATAGGWRADTVRIHSTAPRRLDPPTVMAEDWSAGIAAARWTVVGEPEPYTRPATGPEGRSHLVNNGDVHFDSGVVSRRAFPMDRGITVDAWARLPFSQPYFQTWTLGLQAEPPEPGLTEWNSGAGSLQLRVDSETPGSIRVTVPGGRWQIPFDTPARWHRYTLQLSPGGDVLVAVDDSVVWKVARAAPLEPGRPLHLALGGRSLNAEIAHGPVRVHQGLRFR